MTPGDGIGRKGQIGRKRAFGRIEVRRVDTSSVRTLVRMTLDAPGAPVFDMVDDNGRLRISAVDLERWAAFRGSHIAVIRGWTVIDGALEIGQGSDGRYSANGLDRWVPA